MFASGMILSITLIGFAWWLQVNELRGWANESYDSELDKEYLTRRMKARRRVNVIIGICGLLIFAATLAGPGFFWVAAWMSVSVGLMTVVILALLDAVRTQRYHRKKLPEIRDKTLRDPSRIESSDVEPTGVEPEEAGLADAGPAGDGPTNATPGEDV